MHNVRIPEKRLEAVCLKHCPRKWASAEPHLDRAGGTTGDIWYMVLCADALLDYAGWIITVDFTNDLGEVNNKKSSHTEVSEALKRLGVDRDVIIVITSDCIQPTYEDLVKHMKAITEQSEFLSVIDFSVQLNAPKQS
jgi:hypothetical protein